MHVEIRVCDVCRISAFDPESFYRVKQLCERAPGTRRASDDPEEAVAARGELLSLPHRRKELAGVAPELLLQLSFDKAVTVETSPLQLVREAKQHEKLLKTGWDGSEVQTQRFRAAPAEVVLASMPVAMSDAVVKIRLLQCAPRLSRAAEDDVDRELAAVPADARRTPLCIGVAKIAFKELITVRGGVSIALQARQSVVRAVEERNLNTVATNGIFGRDVGGSAFLTLQVIAFSFGKVPLSKLLMCKLPPRPPSRPPSRTPSRAVSEASEVGEASPPPRGPPRSADGASRHTAQEEIVVGSLDSAALRFVMVPYMAAVDGALRVHEVLSWRRPAKTLVMLALVLLVMYADILDVAIVVATLANVVLSLRRVSLYYTYGARRGGGSSFAEDVTAGRGAVAHLYGRHNGLLNAMVRAHFFFVQGLQEDSFYEIVLLIHMLRRHQRSTALACVGAIAVTCLLSVSSLLVIGGLSSFVLYPFFLRVPQIRGCLIPQRRSGGVGGFAGFCTALATMMKTFQLNSPMRITRVVHVSPPKPPTPDATPRAESHQYGGLFPRLSYGRAALGTDTPHGSDFPSGTVLDSHRRARTMDFDAALNLTAFERQLPPMNPSRLSFAVVTIACDSNVTSLAGAQSARRSPHNPVVARFRRYSDEAAALLERFQPAAGPSQSLASVGAQNSSAVDSGSAFGLSGNCGASDGASGGRSELWSVFFKETLSFLSWLQKQGKMQVYISPSSLKQLPHQPPPQSPASAAPAERNLIRLDAFARPEWLVQRSDDDAVTTHVLTARNNLMVTRLQPAASYQSAARAMALLAAALLQGNRLSLYGPTLPNGGCNVVVPLLPASDKFELLPQPNPCPPALLSALDDIWRAAPMRAGGGDGGSVEFTSGTVLQVISAYKNSWRLGLAGATTTPRDDRRSTLYGGGANSGSRTPRGPRASLLGGGSHGASGFREVRRESSAPQASSLQWQQNRKVPPIRLGDINAQTLRASPTTGSGGAGFGSRGGGLDDPHHFSSSDWDAGNNALTERELSRTVS